MVFYGCLVVFYGCSMVWGDRSAVFYGCSVVWGDRSMVFSGCSAVFHGCSVVWGDRSTVFSGCSVVWGDRSTVFSGCSAVWGDRSTVFYNRSMRFPDSWMRLYQILPFLRSHISSSNCSTLSLFFLNLLLLLIVQRFDARCYSEIQQVRHYRADTITEPNRS